MSSSQVHIPAIPDLIAESFSAWFAEDLRYLAGGFPSEFF